MALILRTSQHHVCISDSDSFCQAHTILPISFFFFFPPHTVRKQAKIYCHNLRIWRFLKLLLITGFEATEVTRPEIESLKRHHTKSPKRISQKDLTGEAISLLHSLSSPSRSQREDHAKKPCKYLLLRGLGVKRVRLPHFFSFFFSSQ